MADDRIYLEATDGALRVALVLNGAMNYALAHNGISPLVALQIENESERPLTGMNLEVEITGPLDGRIAQPLRVSLPPVAAGERLVVEAPPVRWEFDPATFARIDEAVTASVEARFFDSTRTLQAAGTIRLLAHDEWWARSIRESLAAFVTPRAPAIRDLMSAASDLLGQRTGNPSLQGYQGGADRALKIATAIYDAMSARQVRYINPPPSFEETGQKIRAPHEVLVDRWGTCLDLATTYAAGLEQAGLNPVLVLCDGHAFCGHLLDDQQLPELVVRDSRMILNYVEAGLVIPVETTQVCDGMHASFEQARQATGNWWTDDIEGVNCLIDVAAARRVVRPLPAITVQEGVRVVEVERSVPAAPRPPAAGPEPREPAPRGGDRPRQEFPPRVARWRSSLLDLSFRNPLLNMRAGRTALELHVPHGALGMLEDLLFEGRTFNLLPNDQLAEIHRARGARSAQDIDPQTLTSLLGQGDLFVASSEAGYNSRLRGIQRRARTVIEETGANNLFLTLGTLEWQEGTREARAPLFLLPVTLVARRGRPFALQIEQGAYAHPNQCLLEKLRIGHGLTIPQFSDPEADTSGIDLAGSLQAIRRALVEAELPFSIEESANIALLQFSTLQLWQDLSDNWETFLQNPVVRHLVETPTDSFIETTPDSEFPADAEAETYCPIAIDGSQLQAVSWAQAGRSFVLEGPPGTGKSQTITNLIANALAAGQKVLFVAEKQAALDVVRRRLEGIGLGELCLNLHGKSQTPDDLRKQLRAALHVQTNSSGAAWETVRAGYRNSVASLARYPVALHESGGTGLSAWWARQALIGAGEGAAINIPTPVVASPLDADAWYHGAQELTQALYDLGSGLSSHPWSLSRLVDEQLAERRTQLPQAIDALAQALTALEGSLLADLLAALSGAEAPSLVAAWLSSLVESSWDPRADALTAAAQPAWAAGVAQLRHRLTELASDASSLMATFAPQVITAVDLDELLIRARAADGKLFKGRARRAVLASLATVLVPEARLEPDSLTPTLEALVALRATCRDLAGGARALAGLTIPEDWNPLEADTLATLEREVEAMRLTLELESSEPAAVEQIRHLAVSGPSAHDADRAAAFRDAWDALTRLLECSDSSIRDWSDGASSLLAAIRNRIGAWGSDARGRELVHLARWTRVHSQFEALHHAGLGELVEALTAGGVVPDELEVVLRRSIARGALGERLSTPALAGFDGVVRDRAIERFASDAEEMRREMVSELPAKIVAGRSFSPDRLVGRVGELNRELSRKRGGLKIREMFANYGPIISELTPCLMMSPHSVARFLPAGALDVDLVVFDEASQLRVAEAVGAMGRGKAVVVVGDSQQMPPNNMATVTGADDDDPIETLGIPADMESVLSEAVESNLPRLWLSWHYRSQHEALIAFSNQQYYEGRLASFPRPPEHRSDLGVSWRRVDGTFERGGARVNRVEAGAIVSEIRKRLAHDARASIGVVTFNIQQRDLILDLLDECRDERVTAALADEAEPLFVKNLENVQGDERDVILFSLAFSPREDGQLPLNFGPLIQAGGERRLNVAVTRARAQVVLFASFDPSHIELSRSSSVGVAHLRAYMEMAQRAEDAPASLRPSAARDRHHGEVVQALREAGLSVSEHVGLSDFMVDIAVAGSDHGPWVAVFLDGPGYAKRATVADRETLPYGVLREFMGWASVQRVWLPDWVRDRDEVIGRIRLAALGQEPRPSSSRTDITESRPVAGHEENEPSPATRNGNGTVTPASIGGSTALAPAGFAHIAAVAMANGAATSVPTTTKGDARGNGSGSLFVPAHAHATGERQLLDEIDRDPRCRAAVAVQIEDVIAREAPIATSRLAKIVGKRFGLQRVAASRATSIIALLRPDLIEATQFGVFVWAPEQDRQQYSEFRTAAGEALRTIDEIAPRELLNAMSYLARIGQGISRDELLRETAVLFGYSRMAAKTRGHLEAVLNHGIRLGALRDDGASISVV